MDEANGTGESVRLLTTGEGLRARSTMTARTRVESRATRLSIIAFGLVAAAVAITLRGDRLPLGGEDSLEIGRAHV